VGMFSQNLVTGGRLKGYLNHLELFLINLILPLLFDDLITKLQYFQFGREILFRAVLYPMIFYGS